MADNPYLGEYEAYANQAKTAWQQAQVKIANQRANYLQGYGLDAQGNPVADNPFGAYQQMLGSNADMAEQADAAQRGSGFAGGGISRLAEQAARRQTEQASYQLGQNYRQGLTQFSDAEQSAEGDYNNQLYNKMLEITQRAAQDRMYSPADYQDVNYEAYGDQTPDPGAAGLPWQPPKHKGGKGKNAPVTGWHPPVRNGGRRGRR